jgi:8-amino-7-oxononanoate synthase
VGNKSRHNAWQDFLSATIKGAKEKDLHRELRVVDSPISTTVTVEGRSYLLFCSNDYLGLASDPRMKRASTKALQHWGTGAGASRLISGNVSLYGELEGAVSRFKGSEAALVFSCGYSTNVGVISCLVGPGDFILSDALNHASIVDACRLSRARVQVYPHGDHQYVGNFLSKGVAEGRILVVTDGVFSMDGELAPIRELHNICENFGALLLVDDAHGTGVIGSRGAGSLDYFGMEGAGIVQVGTFSKALGSLGGFVAGSKLVIDYVLNSARSLIYSTALPPSVLAANGEALLIVQEDPTRRERLSDLISQIRSNLEPLGIPALFGPTPILPLVIGSAKETTCLSNFLWEKGIFVPPIRPPTVPKNQSRLRISLSALHTKTDLDRLTLALEAYYRLGS